MNVDRCRMTILVRDSEFKISSVGCNAKDVYRVEGVK
jgi:hypothetical protein